MVVRVFRFVSLIVCSCWICKVTNGQNKHELIKDDNMSF